MAETTRTRQRLQDISTGLASTIREEAAQVRRDVPIRLAAVLHRIKRSLPHPLQQKGLGEHDWIYRHILESLDKATDGGLHTTDRFGLVSAMGGFRYLQKNNLRARDVSEMVERLGRMGFVEGDIVKGTLSLRGKGIARK